MRVIIMNLNLRLSFNVSVNVGGGKVKLPHTHTFIYIYIRHTLFKQWNRNNSMCLFQCRKTAECKMSQ